MRHTRHSFDEPAMIPFEDLLWLKQIDAAGDTSSPELRLPQRTLERLVARGLAEPCGVAARLTRKGAAALRRLT